MGKGKSEEDDRFVIIYPYLSLMCMNISEGRDLPHFWWRYDKKYLDMIMSISK
jgi:hypothetical protein